MSVKITTTTRYDFICDDCGDWDCITENSENRTCEEAAQTFRNAGWAIRKGTSFPLHTGYVYCPKCSKKRGLSQ